MNVLKMKCKDMNFNFVFQRIVATAFAFSYLLKIIF